LKFRIATAPIIAGRLRCDGRQQILERLIKRSPVLDRHRTPTVLYYDHCAALTVSSLFFFKLTNGGFVRQSFR